MPGLGWEGEDLGAWMPKSTKRRKKLGEEWVLGSEILKKQGKSGWGKRWGLSLAPWGLQECQDWAGKDQFWCPGHGNPQGKNRERKKGQV